ncbi:MAG: hypothetical protein WAL32_18400 [Terriglobales bacterium]
MNRLILTMALLFCAMALAVAQTPMVIAFQAPPGPDGYGYNSTAYTTSGCGATPVTQFVCFTQSVLPKVSGVGFVIPWGIIDDCAALLTTADQPCSPDSMCDPIVAMNCYNWAWIDEAIGDYVLGISTSSVFSSGCAGSKPCKILLMVWLTQDSGNLNTFAGTPNTPAYVFTKAYANSLNSGTGCGATCAQDVMVCKDRQGGTGGWTGTPQITDSAWTMGGGGGDFGLWNAYGYDILANPSGLMKFNSLPNDNFSGYPVMYEQPIMTAAESFLTALALHYSSACTFASCTTSWTNTWGSYSISSATIAPYIAYMRIGPSSGGENYPYCACTGSASQCGTGTSHAFWPGPTGYGNGESQEYSDQGYLTAWPAGVTTWPASDATGYVAKLYKFIHSQNWAFPIDTPVHNGPPSNANVSYSDTEALLASQYGLAMGMQAASIGDLVTYATQFFPSTGSNWAAQFREFRYVPDHHLQTMNPGNPVQAARFTITSISSAGGSSATITCNADCSNFCINPSWVYVTGVSNPAFNGIQQVNTTGGTTGNLILTGPLPALSLPTGTWGYVFSGAHLPVLLPFESQQCQGSFQTICSAELWEESLDWAYGTNTVSNTIGNTSWGDLTYQTAISNFLLGLPSATSMHNNMSTNNSHHY